MAVKKELGEKDFEHTYSPNVKQRKIILIPKSNTSHKSIKSLRPISLLSSFYKIISNILTDQLKGALIDDNIMPKHMFAYLANRCLASFPSWCPWQNESCHQICPSIESMEGDLGAENDSQCLPSGSFLLWPSL